MRFGLRDTMDLPAQPAEHIECVTESILKLRGFIPPNESLIGESKHRWLERYGDK